MAYYEQIFATPRTMSADRMSRANATARIQTVGDKLVLGDATRTLELYPLQGHLHAEGMLIGYLPKEKMLIVADAFSPRTPVTRRPDSINPNTANLWENIKRLGLDVQTVMPIHGRFVKVDELHLEAGAM